MKMKIEIDTQTFIRFWMVVIGFAVLAFALYSARTALVMIGAALFLAVALNAPVSWVAKYLPGKSRVGGTAIAFIMVVAILGAFMTLVVPPIVQQTVKFVETVPVIVDSATTQYKSVNEVIVKYHLESQVSDAVSSVKKNATGWAANIGSGVVGSLSSLLSFIFSLAFVLVLSFLMLIEGPTMLTKLWHLYEDKGKMEYHRNLVHRMYNVITGYVIGQLTISGIGSIVMGIFVLILSFIFDVPGNLAIPAAAIYFILSLIPLFGSSIAALLIAMLMVLNAPIAALVFVIGFVIYQQIENNVIAPTVQSKRMELTALWVLVAVTIGIYVFGILGGIISIPIAGCLKVLFDDYLTHTRAQRSKSNRPIARLAKKVQREA
jgi:predicted PurR-regulated permease PerM